MLASEIIILRSKILMLASEIIILGSRIIILRSEMLMLASEIIILRNPGLGACMQKQFRPMNNNRNSLSYAWT
eukprot:8720687-Karenia_brevis.AAC.1